MVDDKILSDEELASMSDEEFQEYTAKADMVLSESTEAVSNPEENATVTSTEPKEEEETEVTESVSEEKEEEEVEEQSEETVEESSTTEPEETGFVGTKETTTETVDESQIEEEPTIEEPKEETTDTSTTSSVDYKAAYEQIMQPFKANGRMIQPTSVDDVIRLMQMGANYNKKMHKMKPGLKVLKTLENAGIAEDELNFLIDIKNKNPEAIKKLLKDSNIDPIEMDIEEVNYHPSNYMVDDGEIEFEQVVDEIKESEKFEKTKQIVMDVWDEESRVKIVSNPVLLRKLHEEVEMDRFDKVQAIIDRERILGRLDGISDLDAYVQIVTNMQREEANRTTGNTKPTTNPVKTKPSTNTASASKKAAQPVSATAKKPSKKVKYTDEEILAMSDEEFKRVFKDDLY
jgi:hypothetical protein